MNKNINRGCIWGQKPSVFNVLYFGSKKIQYSSATWRRPGVTVVPNMRMWECKMESNWPDGEYEDSI